ncbi:hypothetical protein [Phenylobacterium sp. J367]|uniref:hypothetical protein n=1 Tax=Phenylobacterium sp. J367 TaxID=2898435 RepID=UPI0021514E78|nr:hypothetical protein [Phenylobacterium sp. J367]MCR5880459.1 hypothetical protein [Phenylobacterium sp. J367]
MAIMAIYRSDKVAPTDYAPYETELAHQPLPEGALLHLVGYDGREMTIVDVWESREALAAYRPQIEERANRLGVPAAEPQIFEVRNGLGALDLTDARLQPA